MIAAKKFETMANNTFVAIDIPEAKDLADLTGIHFDLESARSLAQELKKVFETRPFNWNLVDALSTAILVRYIRPFATGVREWRRDEALASLSETQRRNHERLRNFRDKHIAHSVNSFEENQPVARYWAERVDVEGITSIECNHDRVIGLSAIDVDEVIELTTALLSYVERRLKQEKVRVLAIVRTMSVQEVLAMGKTWPTRSDLQYVDKARRR